MSAGDSGHAAESDAPDADHVCCHAGHQGAAPVQLEIFNERCSEAGSSSTSGQCCLRLPKWTASARLDLHTILVHSRCRAPQQLREAVRAGP